MLTEPQHRVKGLGAWEAGFKVQGLRALVCSGVEGFEGLGLWSGGLGGNGAGFRG